MPVRVEPAGTQISPDAARMNSNLQFPFDGESLPIPFEVIDDDLINGMPEMVDASELPIRPGGGEQQVAAASNTFSPPRASPVSQPLSSPPIVEMEAAPIDIEDLSVQPNEIMPSPQPEN
jgi:hypothetical protein